MCSGSLQKSGIWGQAEPGPGLAELCQPQVMSSPGLGWDDTGGGAAGGEGGVNYLFLRLFSHFFHPPIVWPFMFYFFIYLFFQLGGGEGELVLCMYI